MFVTNPEERQSEQPNRMPLLSSMYETELEDVSGHERNQHQTKRQRLNPSPLQTNERLLENTGWWCQRETTSHRVDFRTFQALQA